MALAMNGSNPTVNRTQQVRFNLLIAAICSFLLSATPFVYVKNGDFDAAMRNLADAIYELFRVAGGYWVPGFVVSTAAGTLALACFGALLVDTNPVRQSRYVLATLALTAFLAILGSYASNSMHLLWLALLPLMCACFAADRQVETAAPPAKRDAGLGGAGLAS
jgi:hypothetical protein